nr:MAG TPA: hypothetical protein [Inoviridae sp.]
MPKQILKNLQKYNCLSETKKNQNHVYTKIPLPLNYPK